MLTKNHMYSRGISRSLCFFLLIFCSFFSINSFLINPTYIFGLLTLIFSFFFFNGKVDKLEFIFYVYFFISILLFFIAIYYFSIITNDEKILSSILYLYCILLGSQTISLGMLLSREKRVSIYRVVYNFLILFMILELFFRVVFAGHASSFYDYKQSLFFTDSNFSSFIILFFLMFALFLKDKKIYNIGVAKFSILIFLLVMTFSRASIFAYLVSYFFIRSNDKYKTPIFLISLTIYFYIFYKMVANYIGGVNYIDLDGSFNSKFYLISVAIDNYSKLPMINKFFGIGLNNFSYYADGLFAHNIFITLIYEFGYLGSVSFLFFFFYCYKRIGKDITYIFIPFLIAGFSLFSAYVPFFFVLIGCIYIEVRTKKLNYSI